jgi:hypothetical protein
MYLLLINEQYVGDVYSFDYEEQKPTFNTITENKIKIPTIQQNITVKFKLIYKGIFIQSFLQENNIGMNIVAKFLSTGEDLKYIMRGFFSEISANQDCIDITMKLTEPVLIVQPNNISNLDNLIEQDIEKLAQQAIQNVVQKQTNLITKALMDQIKDLNIEEIKPKKKEIKEKDLKRKIIL